jgi:sarcosine oxidase subunit alpha
MRLPPQPAERIDRGRPLAFSFDGRRVEGFVGDTLGSALHAAGRAVLSRSFKYHRPRGLLCCTGSCPNCLVEVNGIPNVRACVEPARDGARVRSQNVLGTLDHDLLALGGRVGGRLLPVGFYYRTLMWPKRAWPLYERVLREAAGLGRVDERARRRRRFDTEHRRADVLVLGSGAAALDAAQAAAAAGERAVVVSSDEVDAPDGIEAIAPARAIGVFAGGLVPVAAGDVLLRFRAGRVVVAPEPIEQPLLFPGNDLVGVVLPVAVRRLVERYAVRPGRRAAVVAADDEGLAVVETLRAVGTEVARVVDLRERRPRRLEAHGRRGRVAALVVDGERTACDVVVMSAGSQPDYALVALAGAALEYDRARGIFVPRDLPPGVALAESGRPAAVQPEVGTDGKALVCVCEDVTTADMARAVAEGFAGIELLKRYTTVTMGPCQGRMCALAATRVAARLTHEGEEAVGRTTARPPTAPVPLGLLAGRFRDPWKRTSLHHRHLELGAEFLWAGEWRRPHSYGDPVAEAAAVHEDIGVIDLSTLGNLVVTGPDAIEFLERLYPNRFADLRTGRVRYTVLGTDAGRIMDDGTVTRLDETSFYVTTTSTGAETVTEWFGWWNAVWGLDVDVTDVTGAVAALNVAGPGARELLDAHADLDLANERFGYLDARRGSVAGVPCLLLRIGFVGELGYELHFPSPYAEHLWDTIVAAGARPFGVEAQRILRLEKGHVIVGQDTDSESNVLGAGMPWVAKLDKDDFVGKWALEHVRDRGLRERLVGFETPSGAVAPEGAAVVTGGKPVGRVTSSRWSPVLRRSIGLAWVPARLAEEGAELELRVDGRVERALVRLQPFHDPAGERLRS